jgi:hypothetical protein
MRSRDFIAFGLPKFPDLDSHIGDRLARRDPRLDFPTVGNRFGTRKNAEDQMGEAALVRDQTPAQQIQAALAGPPIVPGYGQQIRGGGVPARRKVWRGPMWRGSRRRALSR